MPEILIWIGIAICLLHSGIFSGLNLALMGISRLQLEVEAQAGHPGAVRVLALRSDANLLLATILWGNVAANVLLTLLSDSILTGVVAFLFSTFGITLLGEIVPQAYFSRNSLLLGARLAPVVRFYQRVLYPMAKPSARLLDWMLGPEALYFEVRPEHSDDDVIDRDIILVWGEQRRVITGSDLFGRLMRGVARRAPAGKPGRAAGTPGA